MQLTYFINTIYAGKLNDESKLAGLGLGTSLLECFTLYIIMGMNGALETLVAQAYGADQLVLCGVYLNRGTFILLAFYIPFALVPFIFGEKIYLALGQDAEVSRLASE